VAFGNGRRSSPNATTTPWGALTRAVTTATTSARSTHGPKLITRTTGDVTIGRAKFRECASSGLTVPPHCCCAVYLAGVSQAPTEEEIVAALVASGFLMEQEVATAVEDAGFHAATGRAYTDPEEGTSRELDVFGFLRTTHDEVRRRAVHVQLLCECKNTSNPFVFLTRRKTPGDLRRVPAEHLFPMREVAVSRGGGTQYVPPFHELGLGASHYRFQQPLKAVQIVRLDHGKGRWAADNTSVFTSLVYPLAKAVRAFQSNHTFLRLAPGNVTTHQEWATATLTFPMVVVRSPLWVVDVHRDPIVPERVPYVSLERELKSKTISGNFAIDFVQQPHLGDFLTANVRPFAEAVERALWPDAKTGQ
jgi:hypothetical protein